MRVRVALRSPVFVFFLRLVAQAATLGRKFRLFTDHFCGVSSVFLLVFAQVDFQVAEGQVAAL